MRNIRRKCLTNEALKRIVCLVLCLNTFAIRAFAEKLDLEVVVGKGVIGYMEIGMSAEDIISSAKYVNIYQGNLFWYDSATKEIKVSSSIKIEDLGLETSLGGLKKVRSIDIKPKNCAKRGKLNLVFPQKNRLEINPQLSKKQIIAFVRSVSGGNDAGRFRSIVLGANKELESLIYDEYGLLFGFQNNTLVNIRIWSASTALNSADLQSESIM